MGFHVMMAILEAQGSRAGEHHRRTTGGQHNTTAMKADRAGFSNVGSNHPHR
jgi:hypothetical protein